MGNMIHDEDSNGNEKRYEYDQKGNKIYEYEDNHEFWYEYDSKGNVIHAKSSSNWGIEYWCEYTTHPNGKLKSLKHYMPF